MTDFAKQIRRVVESRMEIDDIDILNKNITIITNFEGSSENKRASLEYLVSAHPNSCVLISPYETSEYFLYFTEKYEEKEILYDGLVVYSDLYEKISECIKNNMRLIVFPLLILFIKNNKIITAHWNMMVIDTQIGLMNKVEIERFEPWGTLSDDKIGIEIDDKINREIKWWVNRTWKLKWRYIEPTGFCPAFSFQKIEGAEGKKIAWDPEGFCVAWSIWYADLRLGHPEISRSNLVKVAINLLNAEPKLFTTFIRNYAEYLMIQKDLAKMTKISPDISMEEIETGTERMKREDLEKRTQKLLDEAMELEYLENREINQMRGTEMEIDPRIEEEYLEMEIDPRIEEEDIIMGE